LNAPLPIVPRRPAGPLAPYMALAALWLLTISIVPPRGDFPLNDDWMYAKVVKNIVETGHYEANPYVDPTFILQAYWGAAFVKVFGFSFETLRISTLVLGLVALWSAHWAAREAGLMPRWAFLVALSLMVNPLFLNLSYTFMTDVPFITLTTLSAAAFLRALRTQRLAWIAAGSGIAAGAFFIRQFGVLVPMAFAPALFLAPSRDVQDPPPTRLAASIGVFIAPWVIAIGLYSLLPVGGLGASTGWDWSALGESLPARAAEILRHLGLAFTYLALFGAPIVVAAIRGLVFRRSASRVALLLGLSALIAWLIIPEWPHRLPNLGNLLLDLGVGPLLMPGMLDGDTIMAPLRMGAVPWWLITTFAIIGASALTALHFSAGVRVFTPAVLRDPGRRAEFFLALWSLGMLLVLIMPPVLARFDRYFVMAQVPAAILAARWIAARDLGPARASYVAAAAMYLFGVVCLQDYLAWNAARWKSFNALQHEHAASVEEINGGYEFNGWHHSDLFADESRRMQKKVFGPFGWWIRGDTYRVSMRETKRFQVIGREPYFSWLGFQRREMLILKRIEPEPPL